MTKQAIVVQDWGPVADQSVTEGHPHLSGEGRGGHPIKSWLVKQLITQLRSDFCHCFRICVDMKCTPTLQLKQIFGIVGPWLQCMDCVILWCTLFCDSSWCCSCPAFLAGIMRICCLQHLAENTKNYWYYQ